MDDIQTHRPPYLMAALVVLGALILYVVTLAPTTQFWDTSEYIAAAYVLGIPHPPGNPLFTMLAHVWGLIPWMSSYAARINLFAAVTSAVAAGCWFLVGERWLRDVVPSLWPRRLAALAGAIVAATAFTVWNQSVVNEKVYTLSLLSIALILWLIAVVLVIWGIVTLVRGEILMGVVLIVVGLTYFPALALGPLAEAVRVVEDNQRSVRLGNLARVPVVLVNSRELPAKVR